MGQQRTDTAIQLAAKRRVAERRRCFHCGRAAAMSSRYELVNDFGRVIGSARECNYCGAVRGVRDHEPFREAPE